MRGRRFEAAVTPGPGGVDAYLRPALDYAQLGASVGRLRRVIFLRATRRRCGSGRQRLAAVPLVRGEAGAGDVEWRQACGRCSGEQEMRQRGAAGWARGG